MKKILSFLALSFLISCQHESLEEIKKEVEKPKQEKKEQVEQKQSTENNAPADVVQKLTEQDFSFWSTFGKSDANESNIVDESWLKNKDVFKHDKKQENLYVFVKLLYGIK